MVEGKTAVTINGHCIQWEPAANFQPVFAQNPLEKSWLDIESNNCPVCNVTSCFYLMLTPNFAVPIIWILLLVLLLALLTASVTDNSSVKDAAGTRRPPPSTFCWTPCWPQAWVEWSSLPFRAKIAQFAPLEPTPGQCGASANTFL